MLKLLFLILYLNIGKDYEIAPMAANVQWIFYHDKAREIWVKFLLNEK